MLAEPLRDLAVPLDDLTPLEGNPRRGDVAAVARSLRRFGQRKPIVARRDGTVVAGNHTLAAARELGWSEIAVVRVDDDEATAKAYALADNRTSVLGSFDEADLAAMVGEVFAADPELLEAASFDEAYLNELLAGREPPTALTDPDEVPDVPVQTVSALGDLWLLGPHRLLCGDSTGGAVVERVMGDGRADCVWTDPPYGVAYESAVGDIQNDDLNHVALTDFLRASLAATLAFTKGGAAWYVSFADKTLLAAATVLDELGIYRNVIVWVKDQLVLGRGDYHSRHEVVFYGWTPGAAHHAVEDRTQDTVWEIPRPKRSDEHPTMKPVELVARALRNSTRVGALVLDPFAGSGSTLIACHETRRIARLVELDPPYVDVICRRYQEHTGTVPVLESSGEPHDFTT
jgi:site-specific DNA-methyltransferase (adenine-specific)